MSKTYAKQLRSQLEKNGYSQNSIKQIFELYEIPEA